MNLRACALVLPFLTFACVAGSSGGFIKPDGGEGGVTTSDSGTSKDGSTTKDSGSCKTAPPSNVCGVAPQCGCGSNQTCYVTDVAGTVACIGAGSKPMGATCSATSECAVGLTCELGACHSFCEGGSTCSNPKTSVCVQLEDGNGGTVPNDNICRIKCSLDSPATACGTGNCTFVEGGNTDCVGSGTSTSCSSSNPFACQQGSLCLTDNTCHKWCKVGNSCPTGSCTAFSSPAVVNGVEYGFCP